MTGGGAVTETVYRCELAWMGGEQAVGDVTVTIAGDRITSISTGDPAPAGAIHLAGLTIPGFANAHSHAFQRALRARTQVGTGSFWTWRRQMYDLAARLDPDSYFVLARATFAEMVLTGITAVGEFHYLHHGPDGPYDDPNAMAAALAAAADEAGLRMTLLDTCYLRGGVDVELSDEQRRFSDGDAMAWAARVDALDPLVSPGLRIGAAVHSVRAVDPSGIETVAEWARRRGAPLHAHVSEQPAENEQCLAAYGCTPTELLGRCQALGDRFTAVHATHLTETDVSLLAANGCSVCLCPTTERDLADGIGPSSPLVEAGVPLALGTDSQAMIDPLEEARAVELDERLASHGRGRHDAPSLLRAATGHGHTALGWPEAGGIEVGALADLVSIRLDSVRTAGSTEDHALEAAVFAAGPADVHHVVTGGRVVVDEHRHVDLDVASELDHAVNGVLTP